MCVWIHITYRQYVLNVYSRMWYVLNLQKKNTNFEKKLILLKNCYLKVCKVGLFKFERKGTRFNMEKALHRAAICQVGPLLFAVTICRCIKPIIEHSTVLWPLCPSLSSQYGLHIQPLPLRLVFTLLQARTPNEVTLSTVMLLVLWCVPVKPCFVDCH